MKTLLITGINGFLGSRLATLLSKEFTIIGLSRTRDKLFRLKNQNFKVYASDTDALFDIFKENKIDIIIHTATVYGRENKDIHHIIRSNLLLPVQLYELAESFNIPLFINTDSFFSKNSSTHLGNYVLSKRQVLEWLMQIQGKCKIVNMIIYHQYGPMDSPDKFVTWILNLLKEHKSVIDLTKGTQQRDFIYIDDVVDAYKCVCYNYDQLLSFSEFHVGSGISVSIKEFVEQLKFQIKSPSFLNWGILPYQDNEIMFSVADNQSLKKLGWLPRYSTKEGIEQLIRFEQ